MGIIFDSKDQVFKLDTLNTSYLIGLVDEEQHIGHIYYGKTVDDHSKHLLRTEEAPYVPSVNNRDRISFYDCFPTEYSSSGVGDYRESSIEIETLSGHTALKLTYLEHEIYKGKKQLEGLPGTFGKDHECMTLELHCHDVVLGIRVVLSYTVFEATDVIARSVKVMNESDIPLYLTKVMSVCLDMDNEAFDMITMHGSWARERAIQRKPVGYGKQGVASSRGESGHQDHPFFALANKNTTQENGEVYGFSLVYSGNHMASVEMDQFESVRMVMGINPKHFKWRLTQGMSFQAPEVLLTYSDKGIGQMSRNYHDLIRNHLIRGKYKDKKRPILINNWEATYFDFDSKKLFDIAKEAHGLGVEMLVMDDGWFGDRESDNMALGDWFVNEKKLKGGLKPLVEKINGLGMKFGIWFEPEMVSPDSDLYRQHPDWAIAIPGRVGALARNQYVLDFSREDVVAYIYERITSILKSANIEYVKWDMNRPLSDLGSCQLPADQQGELSHRYMLGVYKIQEQLVQDFPEVLLENCSGGGARFDPGMLYYSPQIWCSDDTDAIERLRIQEGTAMIYPLSTIGAHVSDCPNHSVGRSTPFETRGMVALAGTFGYELDVTKLSEADKNQIPEQVALYHKFNDLVRSGDYYRLTAYSENKINDCWQVVSKDKKESLVTFIQVMNRPNGRSKVMKLQGLDPEKRYEVVTSGKVYSGNTLMNAGLVLDKLWGDYKGTMIHIIEQN